MKNFADCLDIEERRDNSNYVYEELQKPLGRGSGGFYETSFIWKYNHPPLKNSRSNRLGRLSSLVKDLQRYDNIIQEQIKEGIVEKKVFYLPHRPVIRESAETAKLRIVYDASSKPTKNFASLNDYLETGPPLQNSTWDTLVRSRFKPILLCGDIKKAFLQIRIRGCERNVLRFHWVNKCDTNRVEINMFTRLLFELPQFQFILEATLKAHFHN